MPNKEESAARHRMVVEEVEIPEATSKKATEETVREIKPDILEEAASTSSQEVLQDQSREESAEEKMTDNGFQQTDVKVIKEKSPVFWILVPGIFILGAILGGIFFYQKEVNTIDAENTPTPVATPEVSVTPTPTTKAEQKIDVSEFDIAILNGSGIAGEAGKVKTLLEDAGFSVTSTGNAPTYDYTKTIIKAKSTVDNSVIEKLKEALLESYEVGDSQTLPSSSTTDIQVIVGSSKAE